MRASQVLLIHCHDVGTAFICLANIFSRPLFVSLYRDDAPKLELRLQTFLAVFKANLPALHK